MDNETLVRMRQLPAGDIYEGFEAGWSGPVLTIDLPPGVRTPDLAPGTLLELETAAKLYLGVVLDSWAEGLSVSVEHSLDRRQHESIQAIWG